MPSLLKNLSALIQAPKFLPFIKGTEIALADGSRIFVKISKTTQVFRRPGLRYPKYAFVTEIVSGPIVVFGNGEGNSKLIAYEKSIAEAVERLVFKTLKNKGLGTETSSGWAAHTSEENAAKNATAELAERDAILVHWLLKKPMIEISGQSFPQQIKKWLNNELVLHGSLKRLRILVTLDGFAPTATTILEANDGHSIMSHGTGKSLREAFEKAIMETCRLASNIDNRRFFQSSEALGLDASDYKIQPEDHALLYSYHRHLPQWLFGEKASWVELEREWVNIFRKNEKQNEPVEFYEVVKSPLSIGYAKSSAVQNLYFGRTAKALEGGKINFARLNLCGGALDLNMAPHFIS